EKGRPARTDLTASRIDLSSLAVIATHVPLAREMRELISRHAVRGELLNVSLSWDGPQPEAATMALKMRFNQLVSAAQFGGGDSGSGSERAGERLPGFENLSGTIDIANGAGRLQLASRDAVLIFPGTFEQPRLDFAQINGSVQWKNTPTLEVHFDALTASNADLEVSASGDWKRTASGSGAIDLNARIPRLNAATAYRYVPQGAGAGTLAWLQHALLAGRVSDGAVRIRGNLDRFPFVQPADGEFKVTARVREATLDVAPAPTASGARRPGTPWPLLTGIDADLLFERASMTITAERGLAQAARIENTTARIARFGPDSRLEVRGKASGTLLDLLQYVNASPVVGWIGGLTAGAATSGNATLDLQFDLPLAAKGPPRVNGSLHLPGNDIGLVGIPALSRVTGTLGFTEHGVKFNQLAAGIAGGTARFDAQTRTDGVIVLTATGMTTPAGLKSLADQPQLHRALERTQGSARYTGSLTIGPGNTKALQIESDLVGLTIDGVAPLRKTAGESLPLRVDHAWTDARDDLKVTAGRILGVHLERRHQEKEWQITRGVIAINEPANLPESGLLINVNVPRLDVDAWENWLGERPTAGGTGARPAAAASDIRVDLLALRTPELVVMRRTFRNVTIGATRADGGGFDVNLASDNVVGHIGWRPGAAGGPDAAGLGRINAQLSKLVIPNTRKEDVVEVLRTPTQQVPTIDLVAENFELGDAKFGRLDLSARNTGVGPTATWRLRRLNVSNPDMKIAASGEWSPASGGSRRMQLKFNVDTTDAGSALARLGYRSMMARGHGTLSGDLDWLGSPLELNYPTLSGKLQLQLDDGRFTKVEPGNAARLLALLSLQALSRTLGSGTGDSFAEGFAFSSIVADATISKGVLATQDLRMVGHSAAVVMSGTVNLNTETQQLHLIVLPEVDASTAALALTVVNPVLGLGTWLAQTVLRDPLSRALALEYDINGTWADPIVVRRSRFASNSSEPVR
ncbi:MAG: YhdP family protein, partial [Burkholderiaceae bacterium]